MIFKGQFHFILMISFCFVTFTPVFGDVKVENTTPHPVESTPDPIVELATESSSETEEFEEPVKQESSMEEMEYNKGSLCGYCTYCKFCKLCDRDCPCEQSASKPNCHMCKYCKFCYLCNLACKTICQPGGFVDVVTTTLYNQLPKYNKAEVEKDIDEMKDWIDRVKNEL